MQLTLIGIEKMSLRKKFNVILFLVTPLGFFLFSVLGHYHWIFIVISLIYVFVLWKILMNIKCPNCRNRVNDIKIMKKGKPYFQELPYCPKKCEHCGYDFTQPIKK